MKVSRKNIQYRFTLLSIAVIVSYFFSYSDSGDKLYEKIDGTFEDEVPFWGESIMSTKGMPYWGKYDLKKYENSKQSTILSADDTIIISSSLYHPPAFIEFQRKNQETFLLLSDDYDIEIADSLFKCMIKELDIVAQSSVELKIRDLSEMFPTADSMYVNAPFVKTLSSGSVEGFTTNPVGVGICDHALICGHVKIPFVEIVSNMDLFGFPQIVAIGLLLVVFILSHYGAVFFPHYLKYRKDVVFIGNTCIDLNQKELYLWSGECRHITDTRMALLQMLVESAPAYKLSKEEVCLKIWKRNAKDGQALYNVVMTDMRTLFITEDPSLELKSLPREGMQLLVNDSLVKRGRWLHFMWIYMAVNSKRMKTNE